MEVEIEIGLEIEIDVDIEVEEGVNRQIKNQSLPTYAF